MNIQFENVDFNSRSGPNAFGLKLATQLAKLGHQISNDRPDVRLSFIQSSNDFSPTVLRLDGIYFNSVQAWGMMNAPIKDSYDHAAAVIVQSEFDKKLVAKFFGEKNETTLIHNGTNLEAIDLIAPADVGIERSRVWMCASAWRPHKRLADNVRLFQELAPGDHILLVAGRNAQEYIEAVGIKDDRVKLLGDLSWYQLVACMKASMHFVHLAWLDHCPNVVIDARAAGCEIFCSNSGGTKEVAGKNATLIKDPEWDFSPTKLYEPPVMDFSQLETNEEQASIDITGTTEKYLMVLDSVRIR